ncbi:MAG TPA: ribosome-associated translation inhibitor RaiA [Nitrospirae bacterium]|nr:ribosome-associated translation inhibitor RaiA [Nitrospirota bacterium]HDO67527.1 ribosome-associated translation inhibitor RaiA [Nitrospirota bacterium]HEW81701.1 ribosome-associated translation inhibitor RaiA [Nitrospirota bacterium]
MNIIINCRHMDSTQHLKDYAEEKIGRFDKYLNNITEANVTLSVEKYRHKAEVLLKISGSPIQAESITDEMYSAIDEVVGKLARQVRKHKDKIVSQRKGKEKSEGVLETTEHVPAIIKNKSEIKPMSVEEAAMQMDLLGRDFFVYTNASSGDINVLYKRTDGNFGLIEPVK